jgi:hypothetical protein
VAASGIQPKSRDTEKRNHQNGNRDIPGRNINIDPKNGNRCSKNNFENRA